MALLFVVVVVNSDPDGPADASEGLSSDVGGWRGTGSPGFQRSGWLSFLFFSPLSVGSSLSRVFSSLSASFWEGTGMRTGTVGTSAEPLRVVLWEFTSFILKPVNSAGPPFRRSRARRFIHVGKKELSLVVAVC